MHHSINRQERRTRLKLLQDLTQCPLVFCDKSMHRPLDDVTIKSIGLVKRDRPVSRVLRAAYAFHRHARCRLASVGCTPRMEETVSIGKSTSKQRLSSPQTVGGSGGEKQRSYSSTRICHLTKSIRWPYHNTHPHMQQHADARTPRRVGAATSVLSAASRFGARRSRPAGRDADRHPDQVRDSRDRRHGCNAEFHALTSCPAIPYAAAGANVHAWCLPLR